MLWPDTLEQRALASLRTGIWRVNQAAPGLVAAAHGVVELGLGPDVDVDRLIAASRTVLGGADSQDRSGEDAPDLGDDELLPDWDDPWLETERERLHQLRLHVLEATAARLAAAGRFGLALEAALAALRADELRESAHRTVISIHLAEGNVGEACRAYDACCTTLRTELGIEPSPTVSRLLGAAVVPPGRVPRPAAAVGGTASPRLPVAGR
nr:BTAD domain-containing putative transcriptional regulator [Isoptericola sediminis]